MDLGLIDMALKRQEAGELPETYDWLGVAIARLGGISTAARALGVKRETIYNWLEHGLAEVKFANAVALANASRIPLTQLAERMGPFVPKVHQQTFNKRRKR